MNKHLLISILLLFFCNSAVKAQLAAHAGNDTSRCASTTGTINPRLGGTPAATGGMPPYTYQWHVLPGLVPNAHLDNGNIANPLVIQDAGNTVDSLDYVLIVTDNNNTIARDTVRVYFSHFMCTTGECVKFKEVADTVRLGLNCFVRLTPARIAWSPAQYLSSDTTPAPSSWTPTSQSYTAKITDRYGCSVYSSCSVVVSNTGIGSTVNNKTALLIAPNPVTHESSFVIDPSYLNGVLSITYLDGKLVYNKRVTRLHTSFREVFPLGQPGICFYKLSKPGLPTITGKFRVD